MRAVWLVLLAGCGRVGFDPAGGGVDGGPTSGIDSAARVAYRDAVMADGPSGYWRLADTGMSALDETATTAGTFVGNCQHGQPSTLTGDANQAARFDGTSCYVNLGSAYSFAGRSPYSLEVWYTPTNGTENESLIVKQTRLGSMPDDGYMLFNAQGYVYTERSQSAMNVRTDEIAVTVGTTYHVVATYDGNELALYMNGALVVPKVTDTASLPAYATPTVIGAASDESQMFAWGVLDEVAIYPRALTAQQIARHYDIGKNGP